MARVLVTGASGYIGRLTLPLLTARGFEVHASSRRLLPHAPGIRWHAADLLETGVPRALVAATRPDLILHFAWYSTPGAYWTAPENADCQRATIELAHALAEHGGRRFVGAGTCAEYDWTHEHCDERATPLEPATIYGRAKLAAGRSVLEIEGLQTAWGRLFYLFGGDEHPSRLVPSVARALLTGQPALCTHGEQVRDFLHVDDVASAFVALAAGEVTGAVNIASGDPHRVREIVDGLADRLGGAELVRLGARPMTEPMRLTAAVDRLRQEVGWRPAMDFSAALDAAAAHWKNSP